MTESKKLYEIISEKLKLCKNQQMEIPSYISDNLKFNFFDWQKKAFKNLLFYETIVNEEKPLHLMFNLATGSGKTLLMAAALLHYYKKGYRHFIFFVNQNNIVDKTENNFINISHSKYLFKEKIIIDNKLVNIKKTDIFTSSSDSIEIKFTTIQKLYNDIHIQRENQETLSDLNSKDIVMIADEAHHLNTDTKKIKISDSDYTKELSTRTSDREIEKKGWEHTVIELLLNKNGSKQPNKNILLEFTATIPGTANIEKKYRDKIIYKFGLEEFLQAGYTKEINLISSSLTKKQRVFQALIFNWYRSKIALKYQIPNFKPVILFRSKTIEESKKDYEEFLSWTQNAESGDLNFFEIIENKIYKPQKNTLYESGRARTENVRKFLEKEKIRLFEISGWIKDNFKEKNVIITNSKTNKTNTEKTDEETEKLLNSLEDRDNPVRAVFTVDRLTEGWDVLNLFDIVRLYQGENTEKNKKKTPEATIKEKQLIGRGIRYFPFDYNNSIKNKRKFDDDPENELRILEELFYYTFDEDSKYISHLKKELIKDGYIKENKIIKSFYLKEESKCTSFFKDISIWINTAELNSLKKQTSINFIGRHSFGPFKINNSEFTLPLNSDKNKNDCQKIKIKDIEKHIFLKALNIHSRKENSVSRFENLKKIIPIETIDELQTRFLKDIEIDLESDLEFHNMENLNKLMVLNKFMDEFFLNMQKARLSKTGSEFIPLRFIDFFKMPQLRTVETNELSEKISRKLEKEDWFILNSFTGTSAQIAVIEFLIKDIPELKSVFEEVFVLKNEKFYFIFDFQQGRKFYPEFILFLKKNDWYYQILINTGENNNSNPDWKDKFLNEISERYGFSKIFNDQGRKYRIFGLTFFNDPDNKIFINQYKKIKTESFL
ncbi:MAG: DEAD/DEAH box helicase family protein [Desulfobacteraceae bacterium]|nr:DEAD/DEAH box helicase family protein [Desulfobacteraceae bacterium]